MKQLPKLDLIRCWHLYVALTIHDESLVAINYISSSCDSNVFSKVPISFRVLLLTSFINGSIFTLLSNQNKTRCICLFIL